MSKAKRLIPFATAVFLSLSLGIYAERGRAENLETLSILSLDCADADGKPSNNFEESDRGVSIGKRFYRSIMRAYPGAKMTCGLPVSDPPSAGSSSLVLEFGLNDASFGASPLRVTAYVDGNSAASRAVAVGEVQIISLPVGNANSIALEVECGGSTACNSWLYFTKAEVQYVTP
jgi:hypothetical protein